MGKYLILFAIVQTLNLGAAAQQAALQTTPLPCTTEQRDPSRPWVHNSESIDSFPKDDPLPRFMGTFRDKDQNYMLDLYQDSKGIFGELSSPVLDADSPTSRLYDVTFDSRTGALHFSAKFRDGQLQFSGILRGRVIGAAITTDNRTEKATLNIKRYPAGERFLFTSRAQFDCGMTLWHRF
jgi:hypothetical protein